MLCHRAASAASNVIQKSSDGSHVAQFHVATCGHVKLTMAHAGTYAKLSLQFRGSVASDCTSCGLQGRCAVEAADQ